MNKTLYNNSVHNKVFANPLQTHIQVTYLTNNSNGHSCLRSVYSICRNFFENENEN